MKTRHFNISPFCTVWLSLLLTAFIHLSANAQGIDFDDLMDTDDASQAEHISEETNAIDFDDIDAGRSSNTASRKSPINTEPGNSTAPSQDNSLGFGDSLTDSKVKHQAADISMDNIYSDRNEIKIDHSVSSLKVKIDQIFSDCNCLMKGSCYKGPSLSEKAVNQSMRKAEKNFNHQKDRVCSQWNNANRLLSQRDVDFLNSKASQADQHLASLTQLDKKFKTTVDKHESEDYRIRRARERAAENSGGGFNFSKLAALGLGAAIGGIGGLDSASQLELVSGMIADSAEGVEGASNFRSSADSAMTRLNRQNQTSGSAYSGQSSNSEPEPEPEPELIDGRAKGTCPDKSRYDEIVQAYTRKCLKATMKFFRVTVCHLLDKTSSAAEKCQSACGNAQCLEKPPNGSAGGTGDADEDFFNSL